MDEAECCVVDLCEFPKPLSGGSAFSCHCYPKFPATPQFQRHKNQGGVQAMGVSALGCRRCRPSKNTPEFVLAEGGSHTIPKKENVKIYGFAMGKVFLLFKTS